MRRWKPLELCIEFSFSYKGVIHGARNHFQQNHPQRDPRRHLYQDDLVTAFRDIQPKARTHILIIPNVLIPTVNDVEPDHELALGRMFTVARKLASDAGIAEDGYRLIMNCNRHGGQEVYHIHLHLVGGEPLGPC
jgi:histidine triad (HIT) family protein